MLSKTLREIKTAVILLLLFTLLTGLIYPTIVTGIAQLFFPWLANGSLINYDGKNIGSQFIGQSFSDPRYFWGRPSATTPYPNNALSSTGSNLGPTNPTLITVVSQRIAELKKWPTVNALVPVDLVTACASGLDPEISPLAAFYQVPRIAMARGLSEEKIKLLILHFIKRRTFGFLGEPRINVLQLNIALDKLEQRSHHGKTTPQSRKIIGAGKSRRTATTSGTS